MFDIHSPRPILATCPREMPPVLAQEAQDLGFKPLRLLHAGVEFSGGLNEAMRLNLHLRTAHRVHMLLSQFLAESPDTLYKQAMAIPWEKILAPDGYVSIHSHVATEAVNDSRFANLRLKDAIVDRMRKKTGHRPDSGPDKTKSVVFLYWYGKECQVWLDTSGEPLNRRGYRKMPHGAPLQETLAAGLLLSSRFRPGHNFVNPMCGSGTLGTEAALLAMNHAPGLLRDNFGFMHVLGYDIKTFQSLVAEAQKSALPSPKGKFILTDHSPAAIKAARTNAQAAGLAEFLSFEVCDFKDTAIPEGEGVAMLNPEYGKRLGDEEKLEAVYTAIGDFFKQRCAGYTGYIFTGNLKLAKKVGLRAKRKMIFYNSKIECRLLEYELYAGSAKTGPDTGPE